MPVEPVNQQGWCNTVCSRTDNLICDYCGKPIREGQRYWLNQITKKCTHDKHLECMLAENWQEIVIPSNVKLLDSHHSSITENGVWNSGLENENWNGLNRNTSADNAYQEFQFYGVGAVSYTHLTLPTILLV